MKGYLTVFLAMSLSILTGFILLLTGSAVKNAEKVRFESAVDTGMNAVLSEFHIGLLERYGLIYVDASYLEKAPAHLDSSAAWLMRVLVNGCKSRLRLAWRRVGPLPEMLPTPGPEERQELEELFALPPEDRVVIHLHYYEGYSTDESAQILGCRPGTVRSRLSRARDRLRMLLEL